MSRIGKQPIMLPAGVTVTQDGRVVTVSGPKGTLRRTIRPELDIVVEGNTLVVKAVGKSRETPAYWGLTRSLLAGMISGTSRGFEKKLELEGIGYRAGLEGVALQLSVGFSHPVRVEAPPGITFKVEKNMITVAGVDPELVGDVAAQIRRIRPPEPYKGKGIRYAGEIIRKKAGKKAVTTAG